MIKLLVTRASEMVIVLMLFVPFSDYALMTENGQVRRRNSESVFSTHVVGKLIEGQFFCSVHTYRSSEVWDSCVL
jgi:hypothetical protein